MEPLPLNHEFKFSEIKQYRDVHGIVIRSLYYITK